MSHAPDVARLQRISLELLDRPAPLRGFLHNRNHSKGTALQPAGHSFFALGDHKVDLLESSFCCLPVNALEESSDVIGSFQTVVDHESVFEDIQDKNGVTPRRMPRIVFINPASVRSGAS